MTLAPALCMWLLSVLIARAAEPVALAERDAVARAADPSLPAVRAADADLRGARAAVGAAAAVDDPVITVGATRYSARTTWAAEWTLPLFGQRVPWVRAARADADAVEAAGRGDALRRAAEVDDAWIELWAAQAHAALSVEVAADAAALRDAAVAREAAGDAPHLDVLAAQVEASRAEADAAGAEAERAAASATLAGLLGLSETLAADGAPALDPPDAAPGVHPDALADARSVAASEARARGARAAWVPDLTVGVEADVGDPGLPGTDVLATVGVALPLGGGAAPAVRAADAEAEAIRARAADAAARRAAALQSARHTFDAARARLAALDATALPAAAASAALTREAYTAGEVDIVAVLAASAALHDTQRERIDAAASTAHARRALELAAGVSDVP